MGADEGGRLKNILIQSAKIHLFSYSQITPSIKYKTPFDAFDKNFHETLVASIETEAHLMPTDYRHIPIQYHLLPSWL